MNTNSSSQAQSRPLWWQFALYRDGRVTGADSVGQCIRTILSTPKGSDPLRPEFGSDAWKYIDRPVAQAIPHVIRESVEAVRRFEPRCHNLRVKPQVKGEHVTLHITWTLQNGGEGSVEVVWR
ncbi:TPA: GPW/gp25 family protein [Salmonella enterica subsp. enterica serovar Muenchen]